MTSLLIQVGGMPNSGVRPEMNVEDFIEGTEQRLRIIGESIREISDLLMQQINDLAKRPDQLSIAFGVNAGGEAGVPFVTKGTIGANFTVTLSWDAEV